MLGVLVIWSAISAIPLHLSYDAPERCPSEEAFFERIQRREPAVEIADGNGLSRYDVRIERAETGYVGTLDVTGRARQVEGASCDEVADALALMVVLSLARAPKEVEAAAPKQEQPPAPRVPVRPIGIGGEGPREASRADPWRFAVGLSVGGLSGLMPNAQLVTPVFIELSDRTLALRVAVAWMDEDLAIAGSGLAQFGWTGGRIEGCAFRWFVEEQLVFDPCIRVGLGELRGRVEGVSEAAAASEPWMSVGPVARLRWEFSQIFFEIEGSTEFALRRQRFFLSPSETLHQVSTASVEGAVGVGAIF